MKPQRHSLYLIKIRERHSPFSYFNLNEDFKETKTILLFDYQNRDPLTNQATVYPIAMNLIKNQ